MLTEPTPSQIERLPKYARDYVKTLQHRITMLKAEVQNLAKANPPSRVNANPYSRVGDAPLYLNEHSAVAFELSSGEVRVKLNKTTRNGEDTYTLNVNGSSGLTIKPNSSNDVTVTAESW